MLDVNGGEFVVIALLAALLLGPDRLPELARQAARLIRRGRDFATGASAQLRDEVGVDLDRVDWRRYDPRQYHPRRIVRNALSDAFDDESPATTRTPVGTPPGAPTAARDGASPAASKRAEAARSSSARPAAATKPVSTTGSSRQAAGTAAVQARRPSPPPTDWAEAARRAGVDPDST